MTLALGVALVLSLGTFVFTSGKAWAQQLPQAQQQHVEVTQHVVMDGEVAEQGAGTPPATSAATETPPASTLLIYSVPPVDQHDPDMGSEPTSSVPGLSDRYEPEVVLDPEPVPSAPGPLDHYDAETPVDPGPTPVGSRVPEPVPTTPESDSVSSLDPEPAPPLDPTPVPEPVAFEELEPLSSYAEEAPASEPIVPRSGQDESYPLTGLETAVGSVVGTLESAANVLGSFTDGAVFRSASEDEGPIGAGLVDLFSGVEAGPAPAVEGGAKEPGSPSGGTGSPSRDSSPQPSSPFMPAPVGSTFFSLSGGGEIGHGGVAPLLLGVLVSVSILLRRDHRLSWAFCDFSKPSSALLLPLERPG